MERLVEKVKSKLWTFGYSVKDLSDSALGFDLLVGKKHKVKVLEKGGDLDAIPKNIIVAVVDGDEITYHICRGGTCWEESSPLKAFPKVDID